MSASRVRAFLRDSFVSGFSVYRVLFQITVPLLVAVRFLDLHFNLIARSGDALAPLMALVGLPGDAAIVFATALFLQVYAAILVAVELWATLELTTAQVTILMTMVLVAHALPVELRIVQKAGMPIAYALLLRIGGAFALGGILHLLYGDTFLQQPAPLPFSAPPPQALSWTEWLQQQLRNWAAIFAIVQALMLFVNLMRITRAERILIWLLAPLLRLMGIGEKAVTMTMIGMMMGISYGGGLLIAEGRKGGMSRRDRLCALSLLCLCHSAVEDTLLVMLVGAHVSGVLVARCVFAFAFVALLNLLLLSRRAADAGG